MRLWIAATLCVAAACGAGSAERDGNVKRSPVIRFGQFNIFEARTAKIIDRRNTQMRAAASIIKRYDPDILSVDEMQYDLVDVPDPGLPGNGLNPRRFMEGFLRKPDGALPYPFWFISPANTGLRSRLRPDGSWDPDPYNYGRFPGEYSMALFSRLPVDYPGIRRYGWVRWSSLPENRKPDGLPEWLPLFDKDLYDIPVQIAGRTVHVLMLHAVPPVFKPYNAARNADQIEFLRRYIEGGALPEGIQPLPEGTPFVIMGDLNADPDDGAGIREAIEGLLSSPKVIDPKPQGAGDRGNNPSLHTCLAGGGVGDPNLDTGKGFTARVDYILLSRDFEVVRSLVHWPDPQGSPQAFRQARLASDHFLVYVEARLAESH